MSYRLLPDIQARRKLKSAVRTGITAIMLVLLSLACSQSDTDKYDAGEANLKILAMYALRDSECSTSHTLTGFLWTRADRTTVDLCVSQLYMLTCTEWQASDPAASACQSIGVSFR